MSTAYNTRKIPVLVQFYADHWTGHVRCVLAHAKKISALHETENKALADTGLESRWTIFKPPHYAAGAIRQALDKIGRDRQVTSRELIKIANGVSCVTCPSRFEFRFHGDLGGRLGIFLSE